MNCFKILGIDSNSDKKTIKHAYAKLLKKCNPEDDPEGYQKLRAAYDAAIQYQKNHQNNNYDDFDDYSDNEDNQTTTNSDAGNDYSSHINNNISDYVDSQLNEDKSDINDKIESYNNTINYDETLDDQYYDKTNEQISIFTNKLNQIYSNIELRADIGSWKELLNDDLLWNLETSVKIKGIIISFICGHKFIPKEVMNEIDSILKISGNEISNYKLYSQDDINTYINVYTNADTMSYIYLNDINPIDTDKYLSLRLRIFRMITNKKNVFSLSEMTNYFNSALQIYDKDPEIYMVMGNYYIEIGYKDNALEMFRKVLTINEYYDDANKEMGTILFNRFDFAHSVIYLERYIGSDKEDYITLYMLAHSYYFINEYQKSLNCFNMLILKTGTNKYINRYLKNIKRKLEGRRLVSNIKFDKQSYNNYDPVNFNTQKKNKNIRNYLSVIIIIIFSFCILSTVFHSLRNSNKKAKTKDVDGYNIVDTLSDFKYNAKANSKVAITLSDVEVMDCYKLIAYNNQNIKVARFMSKQDLLDKNYWTHTHGKIYSGKIDGKRIFFECNKDLKMEFKKSSRYIIRGYVNNMTSDMFTSLSSFVSTPNNYLSSRYISTSPWIKTNTSTGSASGNYKSNMDNLNRELNRKHNLYNSNSEINKTREKMNKLYNELHSKNKK